MGEEWLNSRAAAIGEKPVGDGLVPSQSPESFAPYLPQHCRRSGSTFIGSGQNRLLVWVRGVFSGDGFAAAPGRIMASTALK